MFVCRLVEKRDVKQKTLNTDSRRNCSYLYFLRKENGKFQVCKSMFLSTLGIGERMMYDLVMQSTNGISNKEHYQRPQRQEESDKKIFARSFLMSLPKLPSHYCRASSSKLYLEPVFASVSELHREYKKQATIDENPILSRPPFLNLLEEQNIYLFRPRKDRCDICCSYESGNIEKELYEQHIARKEEARQEKFKDKPEAMTSDNIKVITMDLQAVILCPSRKLLQEEVILS